eukprot:4840656-Amphidinium_carterae.1
MPSQLHSPPPENKPKSTPGTRPKAAPESQKRENTESENTKAAENKKPERDESKKVRASPKATPKLPAGWVVRWLSRSIVAQHVNGAT